MNMKMNPNVYVAVNKVPNFSVNSWQFNFLFHGMKFISQNCYEADTWWLNNFNTWRLDPSVITGQFVIIN